MSDIIQVKDLSKSYTISHEGKERYTALRDVMAQKAKKIFSFPRNLRASSTTTKEEFWALKDVSFEIEQGDRVGIIGRNGAGKSTLLKILSRITEPTTGQIKIKGRVASLLEVGTGFHPELTGRENIFLNGAILGMSRAEIVKHFDAIVDFAEIEKFLDTPVKRYSSGMYVRLAFAVAAHLEPEILVVDEVLAVGDAEFQKKCLGKMEDVSKNEGRTVLFVSHNMAAIQKLCTKGILLRKGELVSNDNMHKVLHEYLNQAEEAASEYHFDKKFTNDQVAYVTKVRIEDLEGRSISEIPLGKPWRVKVSVKVNAPVKNMVIGLGMANNIGVPVRTSWNLPHDFEQGEYVATFQEDKVVFCTGRYRLVVGLSVGAQSIQYLDDDIHISFSEVIENEEASAIKSDNGIILNQMNMSIKKIGADNP